MPLVASAADVRAGDAPESLVLVNLTVFILVNVSPDECSCLINGISGITREESVCARMLRAVTAMSPRITN